MFTPNLKRLAASAGIGLACLWAAQNQSPQTFDVASVKPSQNGATTTFNSLPGGRLVANNVSLKILIQYGFGVKDYEIAGGPPWLSTDKYDIAAKAETAGKLTEEQLKTPMLSLLTDRFKLRVHRETKELDVYFLTAGKKGGPKITGHTGEGKSSTGTSYEAGIETMNATRVSMASFANSLGRQLGRTVTDNTGLAGEFDFKLVWAPAPSTELPGASIFTALQEQLGLRLESRKSPVEVIVIDSVEKPSEN